MCSKYDHSDIAIRDGKEHKILGFMFGSSSVNIGFGFGSVLHRWNWKDASDGCCSSHDSAILLRVSEQRMQNAIFLCQIRPSVSLPVCLSVWRVRGQSGGGALKRCLLI